MLSQWRLDNCIVVHILARYVHHCFASQNSSFNYAVKLQNKIRRQYNDQANALHPVVQARVNPNKHRQTSYIYYKPDLCCMATALKNYTSYATIV